MWDDAPEVTGTKVITTNNDGSHSESGYLTEATLSNDVTNVAWDVSALPSLVFDGYEVLYVDHGDGTLTGELADGTLIFRIAIDTDVVNADNSPQYSFELLNTAGRLGLDSVVNAYTVISGGNIDHLELAFGDFLIDSMTATDESGDPITVNTNNSWIGLGGNWFNPGETLNMSFTDPDGNVGQVRGLDMLVEGQGSAAYTLNWTVTAAIDAAGTPVTYSGTVSGTGNTDVPFTIPLQDGAIYFTSVEISDPAGSGEFRVAFSLLTANDYYSDIPLNLGYTLTDADSDTASGQIDITLTAPENDSDPVAVDDNVSATEDTPYSGNLGINDIQSLDGGNVWALATQTTHGTVTVNADGTFEYIPYTHYSGADSFTYTLSDTDGDVSTGTVNIDVIAVADIPTIDMNGNGVFTQTINGSNVSTTTNGFTITATNVDGSSGTISMHTTPEGFGVAGASSGDPAEIGFLNGSGSEALIVNFDNAVSSVDVSFAWKNSSETALVEFYNSGVLVGTRTYSGGSDGVDPAISLQPSGGGVFNEIQFVALGAGDDYLIHSIDFDRTSSSSSTITTNDNSTVDLTVVPALVDADGSEVLTTSISGIPDGYTLTDGVNSFGATTGSDTTDVTGWDLMALQLLVPDSESGTVTLTATAMATESSNSDQAAASTTIDIIVVPQDGAPALGAPAASLTSSLDSDDTLLFDGEPVDGGAGFDTLLVPDNDALDFSSITNGTIQNIERIDLGSGSHSISNLDISDVLDMTDSNNQLEILGGADDSVALPSDEWAATGNTLDRDGHQFTEYQDTGGTAKLLIENDIDVTLV